MEQDDAFFDKALEGFVMFALNGGEVRTCPSRALIKKSIYGKFTERAVKRVEAITQGNQLDVGTIIGAQASSEQMKKIVFSMDIGKQENAQTLTGGEHAAFGGYRQSGSAAKTIA